MTDASSVQPADVVGFWRDAGAERWFAKNEDFDSAFRARFEAVHFAAARRALDAWNDTPDGALALALLLDQFPRNCFRGSAHSYATDGLALHLADAAVTAGHDAAIAAELRVFLYLPFEHAEDLPNQDRAVALIAPLGGEVHRYALVHRDVIARFGRFPHRNRELGRDTTPDEQAWLDAGGGF